LTDVRKRPLWQIHLSTAIVTMFLAGVFMWLNQVQVPRDEMLDHETMLTGERGWPVRFQRWVNIAGQQSSIVGIAALIFDIAVGLVALVWIAVVCEWRIRRKAKR